MKPLLLLLLTALTVAGWTPLAAQEKKILQAGAATADITPKIGEKVVGGFSPFPSTHIHDDLHVRCLVLDNGETRLAWAVCDLLGASRSMYDEAAKWVEAETGIPRANLMMSSTHTHSASSALNSERYLQPPPPLTAYQTFVARRIADGVRRAVNNLRPAKVGWTTLQKPEHVFNRRWHMKPGTVPMNPFGGQDLVKMNPARGSDDLLEPAGPTDPEVSLLSVQSLEGEPISVLANYSLHYVGGVGSGHVSADYFGRYCEQLQKLLVAGDQDPPFVALLSNGTSGDVNNINFREKSPPALRLYKKMKLVADDLAQASATALKGVTYHEWLPLKAAFRDLEVGARLPTPEQVEWARQTLAKPGLVVKARVLEVAYAERTLALAGNPPVVNLVLQAFRVGEVGIFASPCETFTEIGLELKAKSPFKPSFTLSIANDYMGYLPTPRQHKLGGYETWLATNRVEPEASVKLTAALLEMMDSLK